MSCSVPDTDSIDSLKSTTTHSLPTLVNKIIGNTPTNTGGLQSIQKVLNCLECTWHLLSILKQIGHIGKEEHDDLPRRTAEIIRAQNPGISNSGIKAAMKAGVYPKHYPTEALQNALQRELTQALVNSSAFAGSAVSGTIRNPQNVKRSGQYVIGLIQSFSL